MSRFAKLPLVLLAVLAMFFLMPGFARADDPAAPTDCAVDATAAGCPAAGSGSDAGTATAPTDTAPAGDTAGPTGSAPAGAGQQPAAGAQRNAVVPNAVTEVPPLCSGPIPLPNCTPPCTVEPFKSSPLCTTPSQPPTKTCVELTDFPCIPDCAFLAHVLNQDICTQLPQCLDPSKLPPDFPKIPGLPVCTPTGPTTNPPPSPGSGGVYYKNCDDARAHGASNIHRGEPGYRPALDRDHDGIACESSTSTGTPQTPQTPQPRTAAPVVDQLAYTGAVPAPMMAAGFGLVLGGAALLRLSRRPR